ncbi:hypothetical protein NQ314_015017 [Rhamnusium bicolor]|uniref:DDE Tnp4 domain-containing protein n=1 Tax=Rhamnusium bicolor TaxID=1586634 RepID=A0AAV8X036_9CUCU|nr:hypothetical protein NQ314_015017 [Rhamnusium bicolor]
MTPTAFENLLGMVSFQLQKVDVKREPISTEVRLAITLRYLATGDSMRSLLYLFRVGFSTVSTIIAETTKIIWEVLQSIVLQPPTEEEWLNIAVGYKNRWQFPNCIGAIDGKHVQIEAPPNAGIDIGSPGRHSDGGIFLNSKIGKGIKEGQLNIPQEMEIIRGCPELPFVIVGDAAFPLLKNLLRPYPARQGLGVNEQIFNYRLSRPWLTVENAFGILASMCLPSQLLHATTRKWRQEGPMTSIGRTGANNFTLAVRNVRDTLKEYFNEKGSVPWQWSHAQ